MASVKLRILSSCLLPVLLAFPGASSNRVTAQEVPDSVRIRQLEERIDLITRELERMTLGEEVVQADTSARGFAPGASKVYGVRQGVSIGGYGEILYENFAAEREDGTPAGRSDRLDALRAIVYVGYKFNDRILFNSEMEFEHGSTGQAGSASLEFAYLDYLLTPDVGLRGGLLLSPMGFVNELHEPPVFLGTERPLTESRIIPTTWRENGVGFFGNRGGFEFRGYVLNSLDGVGGGSSRAGGFGAEGLRGGRQKGSRAMAEDLGLVGRIDYTGVRGLMMGGSVFYGETAQNRELDGDPVGGGTLIWEAHAQYEARGLEVRGLLAGASLDDVEELNALKDLSGQESIGNEMMGWYVQAGYDVLRRANTRHQLIPYFRYESLETQKGVPQGFSAHPANDLTVVSVGAAWKPIPQTVLKTDLQLHSNEAGTGVDQFNVALGYLF